MQADPAGDRSMLARLREQGVRGPWLQLLGQLLQLAGGKAELLRHSERAWASATFSGARHTIVLAFTGPDAFDDAEDFIAALPEHEFTVPRQIVADAAVAAVDQESLPEPKMTVEAELLVLEDG